MAAQALQPDLFTLIRNALSITNEFHVLKALALICRVRLASYRSSLKEDMKQLRDSALPMFSKMRNVCVLVSCAWLCVR